MASSSQPGLQNNPHPAFSSRVGGGKLPDRSLNNNPPPFGTSALGLGRGGPGQGQQHQQQFVGRGEVPQGRGLEREKEVNALDEIQEDQREEINEAVCSFCDLACDCDDKG